MKYSHIRFFFFLGFLYVNSNDFGAEDYSYESWHKAARETYVVV